jgi:hypothetical protein
MGHTFDPPDVEDRVMFRHRLAPEADYYRLPEPPAPTVQPANFSLCNVAAMIVCTAEQWSGLQQVYNLALSQAQATTWPSVLDRDWFGFWN